MASMKHVRSRNDPMNTYWRSKFGAYVRGLRVSQNLTQDELADLCDMKSKQRISHVETGTEGLPPEKVSVMAKALQVDVGEFARVFLRYSDPWTYANIFGADKALKSELVVSSGTQESDRRRRRGQENDPPP